MAKRARTQAGTQQSSKQEESKALTNLQAYYEKNKKRINNITSIVLLVVVGFFAYKKLYKEPREQKASSSMAFAERYFQVDSLDKALNGDGQHSGFLKVIKKYGGTDAANVAHYYAGICYLRMGDFKNSIKQLEDFNGKGTAVAYAGWGALGDAYMESGNKSKGMDYYEKAIGDEKNTLLTPMYLHRLGIAYEISGKADDAKKAFKRIRDEYPQSAEARDIDKYLARLGEVE
jgi:tetratricopeptide (TPR) repeat protein